MAPMDGYVVLELDEYLEERPPAYSKIGEMWADLITPTRKVARGYLWLTYTWVRSAVAFVLVMAIVIIVIMRFTA